jgi:hypothetical protein
MAILNRNSERVQGYCLFGFIWLLSVVVINPLGNFPLNDDWVYGKVVKDLLETGRLLIPNFVAAPIISHTIWGYLFSLIFGFSFTVLRFSTLLLGFAGVVMSYELFRACYIRHKVALLGALVICFNPVYLSLSFTFMTDVPFYVLVVTSLFFYVKTLDEDRFLFLMVAVGFNIIAVLCRQLGIFIPLAFLIAYLYRYGWSKKTGFRAVTPLLMVWFSLKMFEWILASTSGLPELYFSKQQHLVELLTTQNWFTLFLSPFSEGSLLRRTFSGILFLGLFLFPITLVLQANRSILRRKSIFILVIGVATCAVMAFLIKIGRLMPLTVNIFIDFGIGPQTLKDSQVGFANTPTASSELWFLITVIGVIGCILAVTLFLSAFLYEIKNSDFKYSCFIIFGFVGIVFYYLPIGIVGFFDRYLLLLLPLSILVMCRQTDAVNGKWLMRIAFVVVLIVGVFSLSATHDYMSWNRVRWQALEYATEVLKIEPKRIDGGMEFNGWLTYTDNFVPEGTKSWWWVQDDEYVIAFHVLDHYEVVEKYSYDRYYPLNSGQLFLLKRSD